MLATSDLVRRLDSLLSVRAIYDDKLSPKGAWSVSYTPSKYWDLSIFLSG